MKTDNPNGNGNGLPHYSLYQTPNWHHKNVSMVTEQTDLSETSEHFNYWLYIMLSALWVI